MILYTKNEKGEFIPIEFSKVITKDWEDHLVVVRVGTDSFQADDSEIELTIDGLADADALDDINMSFLVTKHNLSFEVLGSVREISDKFIAIGIKSGDDLSNLDSLQSEAKRQLKFHTKGTVILPAPITVEEYKELKEIKERVDVRKKRRGG